MENDSLRSLLRGPVLAVGVFSCALNLLLLAPALFMLQVFDRVLVSSSRDTLLMLLLGVAVALGLSLLLDQVRSRLQGVIGNLIGDRLMPVVARQALARGARSTGATPTDTLRDVATVRSLFSTQALLALLDAPWIVVYLAVITLAHPLLGLAAACSAAAMLGLALLNDRLTRRRIEALQQQAGRTQRYLETALQHAEATEAMGMADALLARWQQMHQQVLALQRPTAGRSVWLAAVTRLVRQAVQVFMMAVGAYLVIGQQASPGIMVATTVLLGRALAPVEQIVASWKVLVEGWAATLRLRDALAVPSAAAAGRDAADPTAAMAMATASMRLPDPVGALEARGLVLRAPRSDHLLLAGVTFSLAAGESLVIIGPSGAGKSTLLRVLAGLWGTSAGTVRLDGADLAQWPRDQIGPHIGYVPQDIELFDATVAENIARLGEVDSPAVATAARAAGIHEMVLSLPDGYETRIAPGSTLLSPGQRQRIALARALYREPRLLLLDEPNSNLDHAGEQALGAALAARRGRTTVVMVTHRAPLVRHADRMLVLDAGRVMHFGSVADVTQAMQQGQAGGRVVSMPAHAHARTEATG